MALAFQDKTSILGSWKISLFAKLVIFLIFGIFVTFCKIGHFGDFAQNGLYFPYLKSHFFQKWPKWPILLKKCHFSHFSSFLAFFDQNRQNGQIRDFGQKALIFPFIRNHFWQKWPNWPDLPKIPKMTKMANFAKSALFWVSRTPKSAKMGVSGDPQKRGFCGKMCQKCHFLIRGNFYHFWNFWVRFCKNGTFFSKTLEVSSDQKTPKSPHFATKHGFWDPQKVPNQAILGSGDPILAKMAIFKRGKIVRFWSIFEQKVQKMPKSPKSPKWPFLQKTPFLSFLTFLTKIAKMAKSGILAQSPLFFPMIETTFGKNDQNGQICQKCPKTPKSPKWPFLQKTPFLSFLALFEVQNGQFLVQILGPKTQNRRILPNSRLILDQFYRPDLQNDQFHS